MLHNLVCQVLLSSTLPDSVLWPFVRFANFTTCWLAFPNSHVLHLYFSYNLLLWFSWYILDAFVDVIVDTISTPSDFGFRAFRRASWAFLHSDTETGKLFTWTAGILVSPLLHVAWRVESLATFQSLNCAGPSYVSALSRLTFSLGFLSFSFFSFIWFDL